MAALRRVLVNGVERYPSFPVECSYTRHGVLHQDINGGTTELYRSTKREWRLVWTGANEATATALAAIANSSSIVTFADEQMTVAVNTVVAAPVRKSLAWFDADDTAFYDLELALREV